jgi:DNA-directed RNA polymerase specialized sigma24 family protein
LGEPSSVERLWEEFRLKASPTPASGSSSTTRQRQEMKGILAGAHRRLGDRGMIVITRYSHEGLTLAEIGQVLGVSASRVCQLHTKAVLKLRAKMQDAASSDGGLALLPRRWQAIRVVVHNLGQRPPPAGAAG